MTKCPKELRCNYWDSPETRASKRFWRLAWIIEREGEMNLVEFMSDEDEQAFNQPCKFGNWCAGHAVYCHNEEWKDAPRKCRRTWYTGGEVRDEDCEGYVPNPNYVKIE